jgi:group I intron endonuclease
LLLQKARQNKGYDAMPYKEKLCGIYSISSPNGSTYVGSSHNIKLRWSEHRSRLRHNKHHSERLQNAWKKHEGNLTFAILEICDSKILEEREQHYINFLSAELNTTSYVGNVWCNPSTREKMSIIHSSEKWKKDRSEIAKKVALKRGIAVDCSDGRSFINLHRAAEAFGVTPARIRFLIDTQRNGNLGVRFKKSSEPWRDVVSSQEQRMITMKQNGTLKRTEESRKRMSDSAKARVRAPKKARTA